MVNTYPYYFNKIFTHLNFCLAAATHNIKWVKITNICLIWIQTFANLSVLKLLILVLISLIWSAKNAD